MQTLDTKMTALADEVRALSGVETGKSVDTMISDIDAANTEIAEQADLLAQITTALEGKASGSGGVTLPELDNPASADDILSGKEAIDGAGNKITGTIATKTSSNLTASGATVTVPAGYYASQATKSVATATQATPSVSIDSNGKITATATQTAGYVSAGTKTGTKQMTTQAAKTITPSTSNQTAVAKNVYTTGVVTVAAIPSNYEDVGAETTEYTSLASELESVINSLPEVGGGSAGLEVCSITITSDVGYMARYIFTTFENGQISANYYMPPYGSTCTTPVTISNIVCGSTAYVKSAHSMATGFTLSGCEISSKPSSTEAVIKITASANEVATIYAYDND